MKNTALSSLVVLALLELPRSAHSFTAATTRPQPPSPLAGGPVVRRSSRTRLRGLKIPDFLARNRSPEPEMTELALEATTAADTTSAEVIEAGGGGEEPTETQTLLQKVKQAGTAGGECFSPVFRWMNRFCFFRTLDAQNIYSFPRLARLCVLGIVVFAIAEIIIKKAVSYALWELGFWGVSIPVCVLGYREVAGHWPDFSNKEDLEKVGAEAFAFVNFARLAVPLRIGLALSTTPWIDENVVRKFMKKKEE